MAKSAINSTIMGKAYEFACIKALEKLLKNVRPIEIVDNNSLRIANERYNEISESDQKEMLKSALAGMKAIIEMEPRITEDGKDIIEVSLQPDNVAKDGGDIRDVLIIRRSIKWEIGISVKHNHAALKHSRLSSKLDFGNIWFGINCSDLYFKEIEPIFNKLKEFKGQKKLWSEIPNKFDTIYVPLLEAFKREFDFLYEKHPKEITKKLILYLIGSNGKDYYKMIHYKNNKTRIQPFNLFGTLNQETASKKPSRIIDKLLLPTKIIDLYFKENSKTTLILSMNNYWTISFRIHSAENHVEASLKFDIQLMGQPSDIFYYDVVW
ncbi:MAG: HaeIII family restriction endonuclease [Treponema sp.]|jgi:hypothetical protein|nr:HaeIII family restriction endonuclease [Treponema sp.]